jgi:hypothetical protein
MTKGHTIWLMLSAITRWISFSLYLPHIHLYSSYKDTHHTKPTMEYPHWPRNPACLWSFRDSRGDYCSLSILILNSIPFVKQTLTTDETAAETVEQLADAFRDNQVNIILISFPYVNFSRRQSPQSISRGMKSMPKQPRIWLILYELSGWISSTIYSPLTFALSYIDTHHTQPWKQWSWR